LDSKKANSYQLLLLDSKKANSYQFIIGDVIQCVDCKIPLFKLKGRTTLTLNLVTEKTSIDAVENEDGIRKKKL